MGLMTKSLPRLMSLVTAFCMAGIIAACATTAPPGSGDNTGALYSTVTPPVATTPVVTTLQQAASQHCIAGRVTGGGDTTPTELADSPRAFVYSVRTDEGTDVKVSYTAVPPGPVGHPQTFKLQLHAGTIRVGDYIKACGTYDSASDTIVVARQGDYIETFAEKPSGL